MKKFQFIFCVLFVAAAFISCSDDDDNNGPKGLRITDYELPDTYSWNIPEINVLYKVNSQDELLQYVSDTSSNVVMSMDVNFDNHTMLLVQGVSPSGIKSITKTLTNNGGYKLAIKINQNATTVVEKWTVAVWVPKLSADDAVALDIDCPSCVGNNEIEITDYVLPEAFRWTIPESGELYRIDSEDEFDLNVSLMQDINITSGIDFEKNTLLVVRGYSNRGIDAINRKLVENGYYLFSIVIEQNDTKVYALWTVAVLVPKLPEGVTITPDIECPSCSYSGGKLIGEVTLTDYTAVPEDCWVIEKQDSVYRITSNEELWAYAPCVNGTGSSIDFEKNTLLLVQTTSQGFNQWKAKSLKEYSNHYDFEVTFADRNGSILDVVTIQTFAVLAPDLKAEKPMNFFALYPED